MSFQEYKRRSILPLAGLVLAAYYFLVLVPMQQRAASFDGPLQKDWAKLCAVLEQTNALALNFHQVTNQLAETRQTLTLLEGARQKILSRLELGPGVRSRLNAPYQLWVEYDNERSQEIDQLLALAKQQQVTIDPAVFAGLPEHTGEVQQPSLLWPALSLVDGLLRTVLSSNAVAIHSLQVPLALTNSPTENSTRWTEVPIQIEFTAPAAGVLRLLQSLPLRAEEARAAGLSALPATKVPLFLDGFILKKQSPEKPDEVRVWLRLVGFVYRE